MLGNPRASIKAIEEGLTVMEETLRSAPEDRSPEQNTHLEKAARLMRLVILGVTPPVGQFEELRGPYHAATRTGKYEDEANITSEERMKRMVKDIRTELDRVRPIYEVPAAPEQN